AASSRCAWPSLSAMSFCPFTTSTRVRRSPSCALAPRTVTVKLAVDLLPAWSNAEQVTVVAPMAKVDAGGGAQLAMTGPSTSSVAKAVYVTGAPDADVASTVMFGGTVIVGGTVSGRPVPLRTVTVKLTVDVLPL